MAATTTKAVPNTHSIPLIYTIIFTYIDPIFCLLGFIQHMSPSSQATTLQGYTPFAASVSVTSTKTTTAVPLLLENLAGFFLTLGVLEASLLRIKKSDATVWRTVQASVFLLDVVMVYTHSKALTVEGRWEVASWRGDDYRNIVGNVLMGFARICCALGVGMGASTRLKAA